MVHRLINPLKSNSFFLFGARGTGKTHFLSNYLPEDRTFSINLLDPLELDRYNLDPSELSRAVAGLTSEIEWIFIDEVQKLPKLLDLVHLLIETTHLKFALTGSSARKLKRGGANLLAGRAFVNSLFPLTACEFGDLFDLNTTLQWGSLPSLLRFENNEQREQYLRTYATTYLKEEIAEEQIVRKLDPFRRFLQVAAQTSGQIVNYTKIGRDVGTSTKTVQSYFEILADTLLGTIIPPFHESIRKRQHANPKFYLFDLGVKRALERTLLIPVVPQTYAFGVAFEHFIVNEIVRLKSYHLNDFEISYFRTHDDAEIDLIIERPGMPRALVEIKSGERITESDVRHLLTIGKTISNSVSYCLSQDPLSKKIGDVSCVHWKQGLQELGLWK
jgi:uncharacterized protein